MTYALVFLVLLASSFASFILGFGISFWAFCQVAAKALKAVSEDTKTHG